MDDVAGDSSSLASVDFSDFNALRDWFEGQSSQKCHAMASRICMRLLAGSTLNFNQTRVLTIFRNLIRSALIGQGFGSVYRSGPVEMRDLAGDSRSFLSALSGRHVVIASRDRSYSAHLVRHAMNYANTCSNWETSFHTLTDFLRETIVLDSRKTVEEMGNCRLWPLDDVPTEIIREFDDFVEQLHGNQNWMYWREVVSGFWDGSMDWDLAHQVAKIDDATWEGEDALATVAARIREIEAEFLAKRAPQAERVLFDERSKHFSIEPIEVAKPGLLSATLNQLEDALDDALIKASNGLQEDAVEVRAIRRVIGKYSNNPQQIEMGCVSVHASLTRQISSGELPTSWENLALQSALEEATVGIRATHPDVAQNRKLLTKQNFAELSQENKGKLADALPILVAISDAELADDWSRDIPALINTSMGPLPSGAPALPGLDETTRIFSRAAKMSILMRAGKLVHSIDGSAVYKAARILATLASLVTIGLTLFTLF